MIGNCGEVTDLVGKGDPEELYFCEAAARGRVMIESYIPERSLVCYFYSVPSAMNCLIDCCQCCPGILIVGALKL